MKPKIKLSNLVIGGVVNMVVISILESYDSRIATLYTLVLFMTIIMIYRDEIFPSINTIFASIQRGIEE